MSIIQRHHIWSVFLDCLSGKEGKYFKADRFEKKTVQRLARIGALLPASIPAESKFFDWAMQPMTAQMEVEPLPQGRDSFRGTKLARLIMDILHEKSIFSERRFFAIMDRFMRSQSSSQYRPVSE